MVSFPIDSFFVLFAAILLSRLDILLSKFVIVTKFSCASPALKTLGAKVLNSGVVIYLSWFWSVSFSLISVTFVLQSVFLTGLLTSSNLFTTVDNAVFVDKLLTSGILPSTSVILVLYSIFLTIPLVSGIFFSNSVLSASHLVFKTNALVSILFTLATNLS